MSLLFSASSPQQGQNASREPNPSPSPMTVPPVVPMSPSRRDELLGRLERTPASLDAGVLQELGRAVGTGQLSVEQLRDVRTRLQTLSPLQRASFAEGMETNRPTSLPAEVRSAILDIKNDLVPGLIRLLGSDLHRNRVTATRALVGLGHEICDHLEAATRNPDAEVANRARSVLQQIGENHATMLARYAVSGNEQERASARSSIGAAILQRLTNPDSHFLASMHANLPTALFSNLVSGLSSDDPVRRGHAAEFLERHHGRGGAITYLFNEGAERNNPAAARIATARLRDLFQAYSDPNATVAERDNLRPALMEVAGRNPELYGQTLLTYADMVGRGSPRVAMLSALRQRPPEGGMIFGGVIDALIGNFRAVDREWNRGDRLAPLPRED